MKSISQDGSILQPTLLQTFMLLCFLLKTAEIVAAEPRANSSQTGSVISSAVQGNESLRNEIQRSIDRGIVWLASNQNSNGWWSTPDHPAVTALAVTAFHGDPMDRFRTKNPANLSRACDFILKQTKSDGGIYVTNLATYNTALCMMALLTANDSKYDPIIRRARGFLIGVQRDFGEKGKLDTPLDGGFGYGLPTDKVSDMGNTLAALEAIYYSKRFAPDQGKSMDGDLNWQAAIHFLQSCQNLPSHNKEPWVSDKLKDKGGFIYHAGRSNAGGDTNEVTGRVSLRSYGSISYAGLLSYIYADLKQDDPRVAAVYDWLKRFYTLDENPGMGEQGLYYYYHTMTKALTAAGVRELPLSNGKSINWREDLALKLMNLQQSDGSWVNKNARWWEKDPALVTSYVLLSLEIIWRGLGE